jgi:hypothetical protein
MEPLWSPVVATGGNQWQIGSERNPPKRAKSVAVACHQLPKKFHGKEGVDGSSPSEGSAKALQTKLFFSAHFAFSPACTRYGADYGAPRFAAPVFVASRFATWARRRPTRSFRQR